MPDMLKLEGSIHDKITTCRTEIEENFNQMIRSLDGRIVQIRLETNMDSFKIMIGRKAD